MRNSAVRFAAIVTCFTPLAAIAQAPPTPATPPAQTAPQPPPKNEASDPRACAPSRNTAPNSQDSSKGTVGQGAPLSDKLAQTDGVICPPSNVDPEIRAPTPETGAKTPVIPPPGSPGGDPSIRPK